ncbi:MAG: hypothetical protein J6V24_12560, partial [Clostridia bacterium]|nr:hypothetical protein [Clostridia bacterium]
ENIVTTEYGRYFAGIEIVAPPPKNPEKFDGAYLDRDLDPDGTYIGAYISDDVIEIYWISEHGESMILYWVGSFEQPNGRDDYTFDSVRDKEKTQFALFASPDDTKQIAVKGGEISFSGAMLGVVFTVHLISAEYFQ